MSFKKILNKIFEKDNQPFKLILLNDKINYIKKK